MPKALWKQMLEASQAEALLAVELYNQPTQARRLEGFYVHMQMAWLYLLHARFKRDGIDYRYRLPNGRIERVYGEPKTWDLSKCIRERWPNQNEAVRTNLEFIILLRNKIEHRHQHAIAVMTAGHAQACVLNYEEELTATFGNQWSLASSLRFPLFVGTLTQQGVSQLIQLQRTVPKRVSTFIAQFMSGLTPEVADDQRFELRLNLVPKRASKTEADLALSFVRLDELSSEERETMEVLGRTGKAVVWEKERPVQNLGLYRPKDVVARVQGRIPFQFHRGHFIRAWRTLGVRPAAGSKNPERTKQQYCIYDSAHGDYLYTDAYVDKLGRECSTLEGFKALLGQPPILAGTIGKFP